VVRGALARDQFSAFFIDDGILRGVMMVNDDAQMDLARDLIAEAAPVPDPHALLNPNFDLASLRPQPEADTGEASAPTSDSAPGAK
jgi:hypothetical protein